MFDKGFTKLGEDIYVYNNFVSKEELINISDYLKTLSDDDWYEDNKNIKWMARTGYQDILNPIRQRIIDLIGRLWRDIKTLLLRYNMQCSSWKYRLLGINKRALKSVQDR